MEGTFGKCYAGLFLHPDTTREGQVLIKTVTGDRSITVFFFFFFFVVVVVVVVAVVVVTE